MLVVDVNALHPVDVLDFFHQVARQILLALDLQDVVQLGVAFGKQIARLDEVALLHGDVLALGDQVFLGLARFRHDHDLALALAFRAERADAVDFGDDRLFLGLTHLKELGNARQAADDVLGLAGFARAAGNDVAGVDLIPVLDHQDGAHGHGELGLERAAGTRHGQALVVVDGDGRPEARGAVLDDGVRGALGHVVHALLVRLALHDVLELHDAVDVGDEGLVERIPFGDGLALLDLLTFLGQQTRAGGQRVLLALAALLVHHAHLAALAQHHHGALGVGHVAHAPEDHPAIVLGVDARLFDFTAGRAADVEGAHGQLGAGLADGLGSDDADRFAHVDDVPARQVASVAEGADALGALAGQPGADVDGVDAGVVDLLGNDFLDERVGVHDELAGVFVIHREHGGAAQHALGQALLDLAVLDVVRQLQTVHGAAVDLADGHVLDHVDQAAGEVTGVGRLERRIRQALACAMGGDEVLQNREAFTEARRDGRFDDLAGGLGHQAAHAGQLAHLVLVASGTGGGHHVDGVEAGVDLGVASARVDDRIL